MSRYITAVLSLADAALTVACFPEVYAPVLLKRKAKRLRDETGDSRYYHPHENVKIDMRSIVTKQFSRPVKMLLVEPMVACIATYASFVFAVLYMTLEIFPIVYRDHRGWGPVVSTTPFLAMLVGVVMAMGINLANQPRYIRAVDAAGGKPVPEARLLPMAAGALLFVIGLFGFAWTAPASVPWPPSVIFAAFIGAGFSTIFQNCINVSDYSNTNFNTTELTRIIKFLVDTYRLYAASAVAANTFLRSLFAAGLPLAVQPMIRRLGIPGGLSLLGGVATLALPVPIVFMRYGARLRAKSRFAPADR